VTTDYIIFPAYQSLMILSKRNFGISQCVCDSGELSDLTYEEQTAVHYVDGYSFVREQR